MGSPDRKIEAGDLLHVTRAASVQFADAIRFRVIRMREDLITYDGWVWLDGYELDPRGEAVRRREIFVQYAGLRWLTDRPQSQQLKDTPSTARPSAARPVTSAPTRTGTPKRVDRGSTGGRGSGRPARRRDQA